MAKGFYSVIQYCPNRFRAEAVNVGLVLLCVDPHEVRVKISGNHGRIRRLFLVSRSESKNLTLAAEGLKNRIESSAQEFRSLDELTGFAASRANDFRLTEPRLVKVENFDTDFDRLFAELVEDCTTASLADKSPAEVLPPSLSEVFYRLQQERRIWRPGIITVPVFKQKLEIPFAFRNGVVNLIKPEVFSATKRAETRAATLAINGDLLQKHDVDGESHRLIIVSTQETPEQAREIDDHVEPLFREYGVRLVRPQDADEFAIEVERSAH